jgi:indole-3-glycerol phosphate synthase / phosphoribosylanthranilate isomerase
MGRLADALRAPGLSAIAELKRRSPSAGDLRPGADAAVLARDFERAGAAAVSIVVDERFGGSPADLRAARAATRLPLLAKGFFAETDDLRPLARAGADAVLLLLRDVDDRRARLLLAEAGRLGLETLVEAHDELELERAIRLDAAVVGVNARDLATFAIDRRTQLELVARVGCGRVVVAESGVESRAHAAAAELAGADAVLVGSTLMRARDPGARLADLLRRPLVKVCGLTRDEDVAAAADAGADLAGFVLAESPRRARAPLPVPESMLSVGVFVGDVAEVATDLVQVYPSENGHRARRGAVLQAGRRVATVLDLPWLADDPGHWADAATVAGRVLLAGGLSPENVSAAIETVRPWAVDASRSLEASPGVKDHARVRAFVEAAS